MTIGREDLTTHRELAHWSRMVRAAAFALDTRPAATTAGTDEAPPQVVQVRRLLTEAADELDRHAGTVRRLDDEIELLHRRARPADAAHLHDLRRRRFRSQTRLRGALDAATRALVPGGDVLDPTTILRRFRGASPTTEFAYFGRPAVDRGERRRRLAMLLVRGTVPSRRPRAARTPEVVVLPSRTARLSPVHRRLLRSVPPAPLSGVAS